MRRRCLRLVAFVIVLMSVTPAAASRRSTRCCVTLDPALTEAGIQSYCFVVRTARKSALGPTAVCRALGGVPGK
jgi:hypothetical protein